MTITQIGAALICRLHTHTVYNHKCRPHIVVEKIILNTPKYIHYKIKCIAFLKDIKMT